MKCISPCFIHKNEDESKFGIVPQHKGNNGINYNDVEKRALHELVYVVD